MREGGTPPSAEGQWRLVHEAAYAHAVFSAKTLGTPLSPCSTLVSTSCLNSVGTRVQPPPPPEAIPRRACGRVGAFCWCQSGATPTERNLDRNPFQALGFLLLRQTRQAFSWCFLAVKFLCVYVCLNA